MPSLSWGKDLCFAASICELQGLTPVAWAPEVGVLVVFPCHIPYP